jgi:two-component system invasion response regulator UvrY
MIRIFIADDHAIVRDGLRRVIADTPGMQLVGETAKGREVLDRAGAGEWDVLVLDLSLEDLGGLEVLRRLREIAPKLPVVVLSMYPESQYAVRLLKMGASAYLSKGRSSEELVAAIRAVAQGKRYVTDEAADALVRSGQHGDLLAHERLSEREHQVFLLIAEGHSPGDIAAQLNVAPSTVSSHLLHIREKLDVRSNAEMMRYAFRTRLTGGG